MQSRQLSSPGSNIAFIGDGCCPSPAYKLPCTVSAAALVILHICCVVCSALMLGLWQGNCHLKLVTAFKTWLPSSPAASSLQRQADASSMTRGSLDLHRELSQAWQVSPVIVMLTVLPALTAAAPAADSSVRNPPTLLSPPGVSIDRQCSKHVCMHY